MDARYARTAFLLSFGLSLAAYAAESEPHPHDRYESYNRAVFAFNQQADRHLIQPAARAYRRFTPQPIRYAATNFFNNFRDMVSFGSNLLRGDVEKAGTDFMRVAINSTFGFGGFINMAGYAGMPDNKNDLGDTFAGWGWKNSHYVMLPILGPSTVRDTLGGAVSSLYSPKNSLFRSRPAAGYAMSALYAVNRREQLLDITDALQHMRTTDDYAYLRDFYLTARNKQIGNAPKLENVDDLMEWDDTPPAETQENAPASEPAAPPQALGETAALYPAAWEQHPDNEQNMEDGLLHAWQKSAAATAELSH